MRSYMVNQWSYDLLLQLTIVETYDHDVKKITITNCPGNDSSRSRNDSVFSVYGVKIQKIRVYRNVRSVVFDNAAGVDRSTMYENRQTLKAFAQRG